MALLPTVTVKQNNITVYLPLEDSFAAECPAKPF